MDQRDWENLLEVFRELRRWRQDAEMKKELEEAEQTQAVSGHLH